MTKPRCVILVVLYMFLVVGCARQQTEIARQDLAGAQATITSAKILGAQEAAPGLIAQAEHNYIQALDTFQTVLRDYPNSNKSADVYLSIGLCRNRMNQREDARLIWKAVVETYPGRTAAAYTQKFLDMP